MNIEPFKDYFESLTNSYDRVKVLGMSQSVPLRDIFVRTHILEKITDREYKNLDDLEYQILREKLRLEIIKETIDGLELINKNQKIIVFGKPGSGKTTFLKRIIFWAMGVSQIVAKRVTFQTSM